MFSMSYKQVKMLCSGKLSDDPKMPLVKTKILVMKKLARRVNKCVWAHNEHAGIC